METREYEDIQADEKSGLLAKSHEAEVPTRSASKRRLALTGMVVALVLFAWSFATVIELLLRRVEPGNDGEEQQYVFQDITPSEKLEWHSCYGEFKCARLTVAMDYHRPLNASKSHPKVHIALILVPGRHEKPNTYSTSPMLLNPGGPGGSGVGFAAGAGGSLQDIVGHDQDIIGFDPRGIGQTFPRADCFGWESEGEYSYLDGEFRRIMWGTSGREIGLVNSSHVALHKLDARARATGQLCGEKDTYYGDDSILKYVSTPNVARDMVSIIDAWDEWIAEQSGSLATDEANIAEEVHESTNSYSLDTKGKLVYWGFSYGTLLGATFAAMFPDRVGRVVVDGVVDADFYVAPVWAESLVDADAITDSFFTYCHAAGSNCNLYREGDKATDIKDRFEAVLAQIRKDPLSFVDKWSSFPGVIYESDLRMLLFGSLYSPALTFPTIAVIFDQMYRGDFTWVKQIFSGAPRGGLATLCGPPVLPPEAFPDEAQGAIMCSDKRYPLNGTLSELETLFDRMANTSSWADVWMTLMVGCDGWPIESKDPPMRWDDHPAKKPKPINTSFPLLFVSNTHDPVTPLYAGVKMAKKFVNAGLIEQKSEGHCSLAAASLCTTKKIMEYFRSGKVPAPPVESEKGLRDGKWEKCDAETWPWHGQAAWASEKGDKDEGDVRIMNAVENIQKELLKHFRPQRNMGSLSVEELVNLNTESWKNE